MVLISISLHTRDGTSPLSLAQSQLTAPLSLGKKLQPLKLKTLLLSTSITSTSPPARFPICSLTTMINHKVRSVLFHSKACNSVPLPKSQAKPDYMPTTEVDACPFLNLPSLPLQCFSAFLMLSLWGLVLSAINAGSSRRLAYKMFKLSFKAEALLWDDGNYHILYSGAAKLN